MSVNGETIFRVLPSVLVAATAWALAWLATGSIDSADWLLYAVFAGLLLAVLLTAAVARPTPLELAGLAGLVLLAGWEALSLTWSAVPNLARDEALLTLFYAIVLLVPLLTLRGPADRLLASGAVAAEAAVLAVATALTLRFGSNQADHFYAGRLSFPISYPNAQAAAFLIGFWPAVVCAAQRRAALPLRALALGGATVIAAGWLTAQSKGGVLAIAVSAAVLFAVSPLRLRLLPPTLLAGGLTALAYRPLTRPFRSASETALVGDVRHTGTTILVLGAIGVGLGLALRRRRSPARARSTRSPPGRDRRRRAGGWPRSSPAPSSCSSGSTSHDEWRAFKHAPTNSASSHLLQLGSFRYDIWRVALNEFQRPSRRRDRLARLRRWPTWSSATARTRRRGRTRFELDVLSELGIVGVVLLAVGLVPFLLPLVWRTRARDPAATAAFGGAAYWLAHGSVDWLWTVPACGVPFFLLLGIGGAGDERPLLPRRIGARLRRSAGRGRRWSCSCRRGCRRG